MQFPSYSKVVKGKSLISKENTFLANGEVLASCPTHNPPPNFDCIDFDSPNPDSRSRRQCERLARPLCPKSDFP
jgi:hypothetical protein